MGLALVVDAHWHWRGSRLLQGSSQQGRGNLGGISVEGPLHTGQRTNVLEAENGALAEGSEVAFGARALLPSLASRFAAAKVLDQREQDPVVLQVEGLEVESQQLPQAASVLVARDSAHRAAGLDLLVRHKCQRAPLLFLRLGSPGDSAPLRALDALPGAGDGEAAGVGQGRASSQQRRFRGHQSHVTECMSHLWVVDQPLQWDLAVHFEKSNGTRFTFQQRLHGLQQQLIGGSHGDVATHFQWSAASILGSILLEPLEL
mmetsp:Transcript_34676/g.73851  ORF Transcript_34676/g.73851 Transcript_34676/m.73851 type:complete len:260 (+) Transcript_34676:1406-2185(+)